MKLYQVEKVRPHSKHIVMVYHVVAASEKSAIKQVEKGEAEEVDFFHDPEPRENLAVFEIQTDLLN